MPISHISPSLCLYSAEVPSCICQWNSIMCILPRKGPNDYILWCFPILWYVGKSKQHRVGPCMTNQCESDALAFALVISSAANLRTTGIKVSVLLTTIVEDSTVYFLFVIASQLVFMMSLILGPVSLTVICCSRLRLMLISPGLNLDSYRVVSGQTLIGYDR